MQHILLAVFLGLCGCAHAATQPAAPAENQGECDCRHGCSPSLQGVKTTYADSADGAVVVFSTERDEVRDLQAQVAHMAEKHTQPPRHRAEKHVAQRARVDNIAKGARLVMTPVNPAELEILRKQVRTYVEQTQRGEAPTKSCGKR